jgi:hypothetical protein
VAHDHAHTGKQRAEIAAGHVAKIFEQHRAGHDLAAREPAQLAPRVDVFVGFHRHHEHDVVVDFGLDHAAAQPEPYGAFDLLGVMSAPPEPHVAKIVQRRPDLDPFADTPAMRSVDLIARHLDEICRFQDRFERAHQIDIGSLQGDAVAHCMRRDIGTEIIVVAAQPLQHLEIIEVVDRRQHLAEPAELVALVVACKRALFDQGVEQIALADWNELIEAVGRRMMLRVAHCAVYMVRASAVKALRESGSR